jgi:hypothetical protein
MVSIYIRMNSATKSWKWLNILRRYKRVVITEDYYVMGDCEELIGTTEIVTL